MMRFACPVCQKVLKAPPDKAGVKVNCPQCGQRLQIPAPYQATNKTVLGEPLPNKATPTHAPQRPAPPAALRPQPPTPASPPHHQPSAPPPKRRPSPDADDEQRSPVQAPRRIPYDRSYDDRPPQRGTAAAHSLGIAAMILGVVALPLSLVPCLGVISLPLSALGVLLGLVGGIVALARQGRGIGFPIAGTAISVLACLIGLLWLGMWGALFGGGRDKGSPTPTAEVRSEGKPASEDLWKNVTHEARAGDLVVSIEAMDSSINDCCVSVSFRNASDSKVARYEGAGLHGSSGNHAALSDEHGNRFRVVPPRDRTEPRYNRTIQPGQSLTDVLSFEARTTKARFVRLTVPLSNFGAGGGMLRLQVPVFVFDSGKLAKGLIGKTEEEVVNLIGGPEAEAKKDELNRLFGGTEGSGWYYRGKRTKEGLPVGPDGHTPFLALRFVNGKVDKAFAR